jgi:hypothetical protein
MKHLRNHLFSVAGVGAFLLLALATAPDNRNKNSNSSSANTSKYVNSRSGLTGKLADNYVDFSFEYPTSWKRITSSSNFVKVENQTSGGDTIENFAVGWVSSPREVLPELASQLSDQSSKNFPGYEKVSEGETTIGSFRGYEFRFKSHDTGGDIWGRIVLLPNEGNRKGVALVMLATSQSPNVHGPEDVGEKGELPAILSSFRFGE